MAMWSFAFFVAFAGITVTADPRLTFPEIARGATRIVSGWEAEEGQIPFQLSLRMVNPVGTVSACGGTIIHSEWGLTAAHCTATRLTMVIRAGAVNLTRPEILFETTEYYNHPNYNDAMQSVVQPDDVAILKFGRSLTFSPRVQPVRLARDVDKNRDYSGVRLVASGWGITWSGGSSPENMNWVYLSGVSNVACWLAFGGSSIVQDSTICAGAYNVSSQSTCSGDSGGPLTVVDVDGGISQVGISSFVSSTGCHTDFPAGFARPAHYHDWYLEVTGINFDWEYEEEVTTVGPTTEEPEEEETTDGTTDEESEEITTVGPTTAEPEEEETTDGTTDEESEEITTVGPTTAEPEEEETTDGTTDEESEEKTTVGPTTEEPEEEETTDGTTDEESEEITTVGPTTAEPEEGETTVAVPTEEPESEEAGSEDSDDSASESSSESEESTETKKKLEKKVEDSGSFFFERFVTQVNQFKMQYF